MMAMIRKNSFGLLVVVAVLGLALLPIDETSLALSRDAVSRGEWWRVLSSQFAHLGPAHALMNATGFFIISFSFRADFSPLHEALVLTSSMVAVAAGILALNPEIHWYLGLSGAIYGLLMHHLVAGAPQQRTLAWLFIGGVAAKLAYEQWIAPPDRLTEAIIGGMVAIDAHLYGACWGMLCGVLTKLLTPVINRKKGAPANSLPQ
jgi:rhomboid family GlyGly-CTERM serine protease